MFGSNSSSQKEMYGADQVNVLIVGPRKIKNISARGAELFNNSTQKQNISTNGVGVELVQFNSAAYGGSGYRAG
jgi:hypothetical protein